MKILLVIAALWAGSVQATPSASWATTTLDSGLAAYAQGDFAGAQRAFKTLADQGSAIAETMLGTLYARGQGVRADQATAVSYWFRAANRGYAPAQLALARARASGRGIARDDGDAWVWAELARRHGDAIVQRAAAALAAQLEAGFDAKARAALQRTLDGWRPWPSGGL